ncbi:MAG: phosphoserine aminotransferase [Methanomassiliicoccales archaeon PtaU1.Bin030]|nr:MAG: phosphoserine aminotransferase [Methanomassiliicoccales archaeon PtaU1.Bin030]
MNHTLFTVGPVEVRKEVLESMTKPMITHRSKEYEQLQANVVEKLHKTLDTDMNIMLSPASASGLLEACVRNGVKSKMLGISNGSFGDRWQGIGTENGKDVKKLNGEWGKAIKPADLEGQISDDIEAVTLVANESSTGVLNPVREIVEAVRQKHDPLMFVDGVTAIYGSDLRIKELDLDALVFGTQKALALPPGLAVICCSDRLLEKAKTVPGRGYYFDLLQMKKMADKNYSLTTPPVSLMYALDFQLERILKEGMAARYRRHQEMAEEVHKWAMAHHGLFAEPGYMSHTITVLNRGDIDFSKLNKGLKERGCEISNGYGNIKETTFRIGHMGDLTVAEIRELLKRMDEVLEAMK